MSGEPPYTITYIRYPHEGLVIDWVDNFGTITGLSNRGDYVFLDDQGAWRRVGIANDRDRKNYRFLVDVKKRKHGRWKWGEPAPTLDEATATAS